MFKFLHTYFVLPTCKVVMQLTKPKQNIAENIEEGLLKVENKFFQLSVKQRVSILSTGFAVVYVGGLGLLSFLWYRQQRRSRFHFFDDNPEWQQMDKFGHAYTSFYLSDLVYKMLCYGGLDKKNALQYSAWSGALLMTPIEILDGFSDGYGASWGDELANFAGSAFFLWQQKQFGEIRLQPQFFFRPTEFAKLRPQLLGKNLAEQWLKDYNGQIYWLKMENKFFSPMLGYGAGNMIYGRPEQNIAAGFVPYRELYVGIEVDYWLIAQKILPEITENKLPKNTFLQKITQFAKMIQATKLTKMGKLIAKPTIWWKKKF